jgi:hypothetical protein
MDRGRGPVWTPESVDTPIPEQSVTSHYSERISQVPYLIRNLSVSRKIKNYKHKNEGNREYRRNKKNISQENAINLTTAEKSITHEVRK